MYAASLTEFDLAALPATVGFTSLSPALLDHTLVRSPFLPPKLQKAGEAQHASIHVKLRWRKIKLYVLFRPN